MDLVERKFVYTGDFDQNGLLYWLGTRYGTEPWSNPAETDLVKISSSTQLGKVSDAVGRAERYVLET